LPDCAIRGVKHNFLPMTGAETMFIQTKVFNIKGDMRRFMKIFSAENCFSLKGYAL
jgi:hypothetical protein